MISEKEYQRAMKNNITTERNINENLEQSNNLKLIEHKIEKLDADIYELNNKVNTLQDLVLDLMKGIQNA